LSASVETVDRQLEIETVSVSNKSENDVADEKETILHLANLGKHFLAKTRNPY